MAETKSNPEKNLQSKEDEYWLQDIGQNLLSDECLTPGTLPRQTQQSVGVYMTRIDAKSDFCNEKICVHPSILKIWLNRNRCIWVDKPGKNDYFIHDMYKNYTMEPMEYNPIKRPQIQVLPRPYCCELDYIINERLQAPEARDIYEERYFCDALDAVNSKKYLQTCKIQPPFWWHDKNNKNNNKPKKEDVSDFDKQNNNIKKHLGFVEKRWKPIPNPVSTLTMTCCERKEAMHSVGIPFRHEACTFYNKHFPAPELIYIKKSFSQ